jgi:hypothetical protein
VTLPTHIKTLCNRGATTNDKSGLVNVHP